MIKESVREALTIWEPRIDIMNIDVSQNEQDGGKVLINLTTRLGLRIMSSTWSIPFT